MSKIELCYEIYKINDFSQILQLCAFCYVNSNAWSSKWCCGFYNFNGNCKNDKFHVFSRFCHNCSPLLWKQKHIFWATLQVCILHKWSTPCKFRLQEDNIIVKPRKPCNIEYPKRCVARGLSIHLLVCRVNFERVYLQEHSFGKSISIATIVAPRTFAGEVLTHLVSYGRLHSCYS